MKIRFTDSKKCNLIFKDAEGDMILTEDAYERLLNKAYKGNELADFYELDPYCSDIFEEAYKSLGYSLDTTWFIHPDVLRDDSKMKALYELVREDVLEKLNEDDDDLKYRLRGNRFSDLKDIFKIKYTFTDKKFLKDDDESEFEASPSSEASGGDEDDIIKESEDVNLTCKEYLEKKSQEVDKKSPKYYLIQMALNKDKGWAYIKKASNLKGDPEVDVVTAKNAKKILKLS